MILEKAVPSSTYTGQVGCLFLYGPPGGGKTEFAAGAPKPIWFDFERSTDTLANSRFPEYRKIPVLRNGTHFKNMQEFITGVKEAVASPDFETIVIDSVTRLQRFQMLEYLMVKEGATAKELNYTKELVNASRTHYKAEIQDWGFSTNLLDELFGVLDKSGKTIILIGHDITEKDELTGIIHTRFALTPALAGAVASLVSVVGYLKAANKPGKGIVRTLTVNPTGKEISKNRLGLLDPVIEEPTWEKLTQLIKGK